MEFAFRTSILTLTVLSASVAFGQARPVTRPVTLTQFLGMSRSGSNSGCCPAPACEPKCCPAPACEPACCPEPVCEPKCCPEPVCEPTCCPEPSCGCESHECSSCCKPPRQSLLSRIGLGMGNRNRCKPCDPCGYDLWPCVGECCDSCPSPHGGYSAPPATMDPGLLHPHDEKRIDPFQDDPDQPPRPPMAPAAVRGARVHQAVQRHR